MPESSASLRPFIGTHRAKISQERAAQLAGLDRTDFILALTREGVDAFVVDFDSLRKELADDGYGPCS